jgi:hypothetical protein
MLSLHQPELVILLLQNTEAILLTMGESNGPTRRRTAHLDHHQFSLTTSFVIVIPHRAPWRSQSTDFLSLPLAQCFRSIQRLTQRVGLLTQLLELISVTCAKAVLTTRPEKQQ